MKMIGLDNQVNDLDKFMMDTRSATTTTESQPTSLIFFSYKHVNTTHSFPFLSVIPYNSIWHFRSWNLSNHRLCDMENIHPSITNDNKSSFDICHFA